VTAANTGDTIVFQALLDDVPPIRTPVGRRRTRPAKVHADKGYDSHANRGYLRRRGITARIARRGIESSVRLGRHRWRVERSLSWLGLLQAAAGAVGPRFGPVVRVRPVGLRGRVLQPALTKPV
jgi:hypothetical protein